MPVKLAVFLSLILFLLLPGGMSCRGRETSSSEKTSQTRQAEKGRAESVETPSSQGSSNRPEKTLSFGSSAGTAEGTTGGTIEEASAGTAEGEVKGAAENDAVDGSTLKDLSRTRPFFERAGTEPQYPSDLVIGRLALPAETGTEEEKILNLLERWIRTIEGKNTAGRDDDFYTGESDKILRTRFPGTLIPIVKARFGEIRFENGTARLDLRFFSEKGRTAGEVVLRLDDGEWKIQAINVDFAALERDYIPTEYEKNPPVYGTMQM